MVVMVIPGDSACHFCAEPLLSALLSSHLFCDCISAGLSTVNSNSVCNTKLISFSQEQNALATSSRKPKQIWLKQQRKLSLSDNKKSKGRADLRFHNPVAHLCLLKDPAPSHPLSILTCPFRLAPLISRQKLRQQVHMAAPFKNPP